jgi:putative colanic acid biosysnthesis UDP-glucose lipid carrier transferase
MRKFVSMSMVEGSFSIEKNPGEMSDISIPDSTVGLTSDGTRYLLSPTKRIVDVVFAVSAIAFLFPLLLCIGLLVRLTSRGPVFYRQTRRGLRGKNFTLYKFRSMYFAESPAENFSQATRDDPRVTRIGRVLRAASLDELPQLLNVLRGEMSLIGPRPHPLPLDDKYSASLPNLSVRYAARPGLSGLAQINGARGETPTIHHMKTRLDYDIKYVRNASLLLDLKILVQTGIVLFFSRDAY